VPVEVCLKSGQEVGRDGNRSHTGFRFRPPDHLDTVDADHCSANVDRRSVELKVASPEFEDLAEAESAPCCDQDSGLEGLGSGFNEASNLRDGYRADLPPSPSDASTPDRAWIGAFEDPLRERLFEDGLQQCIGVGALRLVVVRQVGIPPVHVPWPDRLELTATEGWKDQSLEEPLVELQCSGTEGLTADAPARQGPDGVVAKRKIGTSTRSALRRRSPLLRFGESSVAGQPTLGVCTSIERLWS
jgi:hypothetical protein